MNEPAAPTPADRSAVQAKPRPRSWLRKALRVTVWGVVGVAGLVTLFHAEEYCRGRWVWHRYSKELVAQGVALHPAELAPPPVPDEQNFAMTPCLAPLYDFLPGTQTYRDPAAAKNCMRLPALPPPDREPAGDWTRGITTDLPAWPGALQVAADDALRRNKPFVGSTSGPPSLDDVAKALEARLSRAREPKPPRIEDPRQAAAAVLQALQPAEAILEELRTASLRPYCRFNLRYEEEYAAGIRLSHLDPLRASARLLQLRGSCRLRLGQTDAALEDALLGFRLVQALRNEPVLRSQRCRCWILGRTLQIIWEGLASRQWTDAQLQATVRELGAMDFLAAWNLGLNEHQASDNSLIAYARQHPWEYEYLAYHLGSSANYELVALMMPRGWLYLEQVAYNRVCQEYLRTGVDTATKRLDVRLIDRHADALDRITDHAMNHPYLAVATHMLLTGVLTPSPRDSIKTFALAQTAADEAALACALERHRLSTGEYPETLEKLVPKFVERLPHDIITGDPLKYRRTEGGGFVLYSVGWNQQDDGGEYPSKGGNDPHGDWVFRVP